MYINQQSCMKHPVSVLLLVACHQLAVMVVAVAFAGIECVYFGSLHQK